MELIRGTGQGHGVAVKNLPGQLLFTNERWEPKSAGGTHSGKAAKPTGEGNNLKGFKGPLFEHVAPSDLQGARIGGMTSHET